MSQIGEFDSDEEPSLWEPGKDDQREKKGDKPPKAKKEKKPKKTKHERENPDFEDIPGYEGSAFKGSTDAKPPKTSVKPTGEPLKFDFTEVKTLNEEESKEALQKFVKDHMCYGKKPAEEMEIKSCVGVTAFHYKLETFSENRTTKKKKVPHKGGKVDTKKNGDPPKPWDMEVAPKKLFKDDKVKKEVPHTAKVKKCKECKGRGWETCDDCDGWGKVECNTCNGAGERECVTDEGPTTVPCPPEEMCMDCGGDGRVTCDECEGYKKLKCFMQLKIKFINHDDEYTLETTDLPDELIAKAAGTTLFEETASMVTPIQNFSVDLINKHSKQLIETHASKWPNEFIHCQRQTLRGVPVTEVAYKWNDGEYRFWVYGNKRNVYAPDYPKQCCCGCAVL